MSTSPLAVTWLCMPALGFSVYASLYLLVPCAFSRCTNPLVPRWCDKREFLSLLPISTRTDLLTPCYNTHRTIARRRPCASNIHPSNAPMLVIIAPLIDVLSALADLFLRFSYRPHLPPHVLCSYLMTLAETSQILIFNFNESSRVNAKYIRIDGRLSAINEG